jgi:hypothetical protein
MKLNRIARTGEQQPAFEAVFTMDDGKQRTVKFGTSSNYALNPDKTKADRTAYIARHAVRENWNDPMSRGALSRYILWGDSRSVVENLRSYRKRFNL